MLADNFALGKKQHMLNAMEGLLVFQSLNLRPTASNQLNSRDFHPGPLRQSAILRHVPSSWCEDNQSYALIVAYHTFTGTPGD